MAEMFNVASPEIQCPIPDDTCLLAYRGSIAHNMFVPKNDPNSIDDIDLIGIVLAPENCYMGLREWGSRGTKEYKHGQYDAVFYEIRKAVSLLLQGNPNILSMLWLRRQDYIAWSAPGMRLVDNRQLFAGKHVYNAFAGYAHAQLEKMETRDPEELREYLAVTAELKYRGSHPNHKGEYSERPGGELSGIETDVINWGSEKLVARLRHYQKKGENIGYMGDKRKQLVLEHGYDAKNAAHCVRLLRMAKEFLATGEMTVFRVDDRGELLSIKRGEWPLTQVKGLAASLFAEIKMARDSSPLPEDPDREGAERLLIDIVREHLSAIRQSA